MGTAHSKLCHYIRSHISRPLKKELSAINGVSACVLLRTLRDSVAPNALVYKGTIAEKWRKVLDDHQGRRNLNAWIQDAKTTYQQAKDLNLPCVTGSEAEEALYAILDEVHPVFAGYNRERRSENNTMEGAFLDIINEFERSWQGKKLVVKRVGTETGKILRNTTKVHSYAATLKGTTGNLPPCVCGENHRYSTCPYLVESARSKGWSPDSVKQQEIEQALSNDDRLKQAVERGRKFARVNRDRKDRKDRQR